LVLVQSTKLPLNQAYFIKHDFGSFLNLKSLDEKGALLIAYISSRTLVDFSNVKTLLV